ncbi:MAG: adenylate/guanylate cyclase domain-containing protein [Acidobacteria bacterium]|nr:adenylate/guanylate cyclase domain-containing protein [Acidobacteriota bacterium]
MKDLDKHKGGAEVPVSLLFADVRGSTTLAEQMTPSAYTSALDRFFATVFEHVDSEAGVIDNIVGDGVMAMWIPGFVGQSHPERAVAAGRKLASDLASAPDLGDSFPAGVGVHTGIAYVGVVGEPGSQDFTALGDIPNTTARIGSAVAGGELAMSDEIVSAAHVDTTNLQRRLLELKGKAETFSVWIETVPSQDESDG